MIPHKGTKNPYQELEIPIDGKSDSSLGNSNSLLGNSNSLLGTQHSYKMTMIPNKEIGYKVPC